MSDALTMHRYTIDLTNQTFGWYRIISYAGQHPKKYGSAWLCRCACGVEKIEAATHLRQGLVKSCGCYSRFISKRGLAPGDSLRKRILKMYKANAARRGIKWDMPDKYALALFGKNCAYCGCAPSSTMMSPRQPDRLLWNGIDRVDNSDGYSAVNVVSCCAKCNRAKGSMTRQEWFGWIGRLCEFRESERQRFIEQIRVEDDRKMPIGWEGDRTP